MVVDGNSGILLRALAGIDSLHPRVAVPGHGAIPRRPEDLVARTRAYITGLRADMRSAIERGQPAAQVMHDAKQAVGTTQRQAPFGGL